MNANINIATKANQRAINYAIRAGREDIIELLFERGTDCHNWKDTVPSKKVNYLLS